MTSLHAAAVRRPRARRRRSTRRAAPRAACAVQVRAATYVLSSCAHARWATLPRHFRGDRDGRRGRCNAVVGVHGSAACSRRRRRRADACEWIRQRARAVASTALRCAGDIDSDDVRSGAARVLLALPESDTVFSNDDMPAIVTSTSTAACALLHLCRCPSPRLPRASRGPGLFACEPGSLCTAHSRVHRRRECRRPRALGVAGACRWRSQHAR